jgi:hypothetical protein
VRTLAKLIGKHLFISNAYPIVFTLVENFTISRISLGNIKDVLIPGKNMEKRNMSLPPGKLKARFFKYETELFRPAKSKRKTKNSKKAIK